MKNLLLILLFLCGLICANAQQAKPAQPKSKTTLQKAKPAPAKSKTVSQKADTTAKKSQLGTPNTIMPEFPGGDSAMIKYINANLKYPDSARVMKIQGEVQVAYIIDEDGSVTNAKVVKHLGGGCDEEALRVINAMPKWKPGKEHGEAIQVQYTTPIYFQLARRRVEPGTGKDTLK